MNIRYILISVTLFIILTQVVLLFIFGQPIICTCGYIKLWEGVVLGPGNSQHLTDWYTFSHIIHGILFYAFFRKILPKASLPLIMLLSVGIESLWEVVENTPMVINAYREQALAQGYSGDSIINSFMDTLSMIGGFFIARFLPIKFSITIVIILELGIGYLIHDNLTLNVINLIHTSPAISHWQELPAPLKQ